MTDPKSELGARFNERTPDNDDDDADEAQTPEADTTDNAGNTGNADDSGDADNAGNAGDTNDTGQGGKPGPDRDEDATRHRRQVPMYLPDGKAERLNSLYERLDAQSKLAGDGGLEKHADFMEELVEFAVNHEDELAARLGIEDR